MAIQKGKILTITSVKGGTGKSTTLLNMAGIYSLQNKRVLIIDLDFYAGAIAASLNIENSTDIYKLTDDIANNRFTNLESYIVKYNEYIDVIPSNKDPRNANKINSACLNILLAKVKLKYDIILIDTNNTMSTANLVSFENSEKIVYVMTNNPIDLKSMRTMSAIYKDMEKTNYKVILNEAREVQKECFNKKDITNIINHDIDYTIPSSFYINNIDKYLMDGEILTLNKKIRSNHKKTLKEFEDFCNELTKE